MLEIETVAIVGAGREAVQLAVLCSLAGLHVRLADEAPEALDAAFHALRLDVEHALSSGVIGREERQRILDGVLITTDLQEAVTGADLAIAARPQDDAAARGLLLRVVGSCRATAVLASPADPAAIAGALPQPGRVVGLTLETAEPLPRLRVRLGPVTTAHSRARVERFADELARAAGGHR